MDTGTDCNYLLTTYYLTAPKYTSCSTLEMCDTCDNLVGPEGVARGEDALTILENSTSRSQFIDELMEVEALVKC